MMPKSIHNSFVGCRRGGGSKDGIFRELTLRVSKNSQFFLISANAVGRLLMVSEIGRSVGPRDCHDTLV